MEIKNLQIFADNPTVNVTTDGGLSAENKTFYDRALVEEAGPGHGRSGGKAENGEIKASPGGSWLGGTPRLMRGGRQNRYGISLSRYLFWLLERNRGKFSLLVLCPARI